MGEDVARVDVDHPVHIVESTLEVSDLGVDEAPVVEGQRIARLTLEDGVEVPHCFVVALVLVVEQGAVEVGEGIGLVQFDGLVQVLEGLLPLAQVGIDTRPADVAFWLVAVELDGPVVVGEGLGGVCKIQVAGAAVEVGRRIFRLFLYVFVKVGDCIVEFARQERCYSAGEVDAYLAGAQLYGLVEIAEGGVVVAEAALGNRAVVVAVGEDGVEAHRTVKVAVCSPKVAEVVFCNATEEETPVVGGVQSFKDVEILDGRGVFAVRKCLASTPHKDILVVLGKENCQAGKQQKYGEDKLFQYLCKDNQLSHQF